MEILWGAVSVAVGILVGAAFSVMGMSPPQFRLARGFFIVSAVILGAMSFLWEVQTDRPALWRIAVGVTLWVVIGVGLPECLRWVLRIEHQHVRSIQATSVSSAPLVKPSLVFVFGAPLGDNRSSTWIMMLKHYGPSPAHACKITFYDDDRKNLEHEWLLKNPNSPFLPPGMFEKSQEQIEVLEAGPEGSIGAFHWSPLDLDKQHYTVSIDCRDGVFAEKWEVTRVDGVLRARITIERGPQWAEKNPGSERVVFKCEDPEFVSAPLAIKRPKSNAVHVHPGWKPNYRFDADSGEDDHRFRFDPDHLFRRQADHGRSEATLAQL
jgi:hypothetical protein